MDDLLKPSWFINDSFKGVPAELIGAEGLPRELSKMNDLERMSFLQIADWIEKNIEI